MITPRDYQQEGIDYFKKYKRRLNRDDVGLGKTVQATLAAELPCLVLCPKFLVEGWGEWIRENLDTDSVAIASGTRMQRMDALRSGADWIVGNYELLMSHGEYIFKWHKDKRVALSPGYNWQTVIMDESHYLRNRRSKRAKAAADLAKWVPNVYQLSATPIWKEVDDLWMQFHILDPENFTSYHRFVDLFCVAEHSQFGTKVLGVKKSMRAELEALLALMSIHRTSQDAGRELPPVVENSIKLELPPHLRKLYEQTADYYIEEIDLGFQNYAQVMHSLRAITAFDGKLEVAKEVVDNHHGETAVVFCWYRDTAHDLAKLFGVPCITGEMSVKQRREVALANNGGHIVATIGALTEGIDLSFARVVVFVEEHWTPGGNYQALGRVRRERLHESNDAPVIVYYVQVKDTIDEYVHSKSQKRNETVRAIVEGALGL